MRPGVQCILRLLFASAWGEKQTPGQTRADVDDVDDDDEEGAGAYFFRQTQILLASLNVVCWARVDLIGFYADVCHRQ